MTVLDNDTVFHPEIQANNDSKILVRVGIYALLLYLHLGKRIRQLVLYIGEEPKNMPSTMTVAGHV